MRSDDSEEDEDEKKKKRESWEAFSVHDWMVGKKQNTDPCKSIQTLNFSRFCRVAARTLNVLYSDFMINRHNVLGNC